MKVYLLAFILLLALTSCFNYEKFREELNEKGVSNNQDIRKISDAIDKVMKWDTNKDSKTRAIIHGIYHSGIGIAKKVTGNDEGAQKEFDRAKEQFEKLN